MHLNKIYITPNRQIFKSKPINFPKTRNNSYHRSIHQKENRLGKNESVLRIGRLHSLHLHIYPLANFAKRLPEVHVEQNGIDQRNISSCNGGEGSTGRLYEESGSADK